MGRRGMLKRNIPGASVDNKQRVRAGLVLFHSMLAIILLVAGFVSLGNGRPWIALTCLLLAVLWGYRAFRWGRADLDEALGPDRRYRLFGP